VFETRLAQLAELADVRVGLQRAAHRDHELCNSVNALTSATMLLNSDDRHAADLQVLRAAVADELARLNELLHSPGPGGQSRDPRDYDVLDVVRQRVALAASTGMDVRMVDVDPRLRVHGDPSVLAQVLTNVLTNCERHAPGSPVRITGSRRGRTAVLRVCDFGPGVPAELQPGIFECGVRGSTSPGHGFGLYLARRLLAEEAGLITVKSRPAGAGCTVVIELPLSGYRRNGVGTTSALALPHGRSPLRPRICDVPGAVAT
jgi:two-component system OmpR family sensor kinase